MPSSSNIDDLLRKLARPAQKVGKTRVKYPWRRRQSQKRGIKLTETERRELKEKREEKRVKLEDALKTARDTMYKLAEQMSEDFGKAHRPEYYYSLIMQQSKLKVKPQKFSRWNVFVSRETRKRNDERGAGNGKRVSDGYIKELSARWREMSEEERDAATADGIEELTERRENRKEGVQNVLINSFHDARATLGSIQQELQFLAGRTGLRIVTIAVRPSSDALNAPFVFSSDERVGYYFETLTKMPMQELVVGLEGFCISGINGLTQNHRMQLGQWKTKVRDFILEKLSAASTRGPINKMYYVNFDQHITVKFGVVLENWPLTKFAAPGSFSAIPLLSLLYNAFDSGTTRFRSLSDEEWLEWLQAYKAGQAPPAVTASPSGLTVEEEDFAAAADSEAPVELSAPAGSETAFASAPSASASSAKEGAPSASVTNGNVNTAPSEVGTGATPSPSAPDVNMAETRITEVAVARGQKRTFQQVGDGNFVNNFVSADGTGIVQITKKPRKQRSDAGKKRGPRKKNPAAAAQASATPAPALPTPSATPAPATPAPSATPAPTLSTSSVSAPRTAAGATA
ncbi:hypothetical protein GSI_00276 [Ganoderma sinense ZZ0214-1]|uniref:Uncharacterized protein n=1 Tax=Ganoderma sinense ZZ0214-1 TaxID=1077348 RepID=A0A2G8SS42_9APHY|nr:hypothetical protein GSI_00276 [Ganoderma sinense ZZ0214-1]